MRDLSTLDSVTRSNEGFELELYNPATLEGLGIFITVLGKDSAEFQKLQGEQNQLRLDRASRAGNISKMLSEKQIRADGINLIAVCTKAWRSPVDDKREEYKPIILMSGVEYSCNRENAVKVYTDFPWIKEQVDAAIMDRANFMKR